MASNYAAWLVAEKSRPFEVKPSRMGIPGENQILIKNHALAVNPIDGKLQALAYYKVRYPNILGQDVAGEVVEVGPSVTRFKKGDRVMGNPAGFATKKDEDKGFQAYTVLEVNLTSEIPDDMSFERAVVVPLCLSTASDGLFSHNMLNLELPSEPPHPPTGKVLLVWGGASSVGCNAIQLATAAGYEVVTTSSPKNFAFVKRLGASHVVDYKSPTVVSDLLDITKGKLVAGVFDAIGGEEAWLPALEFIQRSAGNKILATTINGCPEVEGVAVRKVLAPSIRDNNIGKAIYEDFLPKALVAGSFVPAPEPKVVGNGLESVQRAVDIQSKGCSAQKIVVLL
jgi:NADPH:quinone reductase-like Zn-dependent oxidoreductase